MTDEEVKNLVAQLAIDSKTMKERIEADNKAMQENFKEMRADTKAMQDQAKANDEKLARMGGEFLKIQEDIGDTTEEYFYKALGKTMTLGDIYFNCIFERLASPKNTLNFKGEYDIVLLNGTSVAFIETKYKMHINDVIKIKEKMLPKFKKLFPRYKDYALFVGIASFHINQDVKRLAQEFGFYVLERDGDILQTNADNIHAY